MRTIEQNHKQHSGDGRSSARLRGSAIRVFMLAVALNLAIPLLGSTTATSAAEPKTPLFSFVESGKADAMKSGDGERLVKVNVGALSGKASRKLRMPLLDGKTHDAAQTDFEERGPGDFTWRGKITNPGDVTLTVKNGVVSGLIYAEGGVYEVKPTNGPEHRLARVDYSRFSERGEGPRPPDGGLGCGVVPSPTEDVSDQLRAGGSAVTADSAAFIEVLIVYTPAARFQAGGTAQIQTLAQSAVDVTNTVYANSGITTRLRLAPIQEVNYVESGSSDTDLDWLATDPTVAALRDQFGGDVVSMFCTEFDNAGGQGFLMTRVNSSFAPSAFNVVDMDYAVANLTLAHEIGHNQGCEHDHSNAGSTLSYPYAHGFYRRTPGFYTVMSYRPTGCDSCFRAPNFSNPNVRFRDFRTGRFYSMGVAGSSENYRVINNTASTVANFRQGTFRLAGTPSDLTATMVSSSRVDLSWRNNAAENCYFEIERRADGSDTFELIRQTWQNQTTFSDVNVELGRRYTYRVRAASADWLRYTDYSNEAVLAPPCVVSEGTPISLEETASGTLDETDCFTSLEFRWHHGWPLADRYTFEGVEDQLVVISMSTSGFQPDLYLLDSNGWYITSSRNAGRPEPDCRIPFFEGGYRLPYTGTFIIEVTSQDSGVTGDYSVTLAEGDPATSQPAMPTDVVATTVTSDQVDLQWTDNSAYEDSYLVEVWSVGGNSIVDVWTGADETSATITGLTPSTTYHITVKAHNAFGWSRFSTLVVTTEP